MQIQLRFATRTAAPSCTVQSKRAKFGPTDCKVPGIVSSKAELIVPGNFAVASRRLGRSVAQLQKRLWRWLESYLPCTSMHRFLGGDSSMRRSYSDRQLATTGIEYTPSLTTSTGASVEKGGLSSRQRAAWGCMHAHTLSTIADNSATFFANFRLVRSCV